MLWGVIAHEGARRGVKSRLVTWSAAEVDFAISKVSACTTSLILKDSPLISRFCFCNGEFHPRLAHAHEGGVDVGFNDT
jgi:hypothetical protein